ncbi:MAG: class I SAM-dependent methyltransferase [Phycisphaerae bacterium]
MNHDAESIFDFGPMARRYDQWYDTPAGQAHDRVQKDDVLRLLPPASAGQTLLDVGCGTGHWSAFFDDMGYRVTGIDASPEMVEVAASVVPECTFRVADAYDLPFDDGTFDVVAMMATLEFLPDQAAAVGEMARCAGEGGRLLVGTLNRLAPLNQRRQAKGKEPYASARLLSPDELRSLLTPLGRVRMAASPVPPGRGGPSLLKRVVARATGRRGELSGPFIVAEVRL